MYYRRTGRPNPMSDWGHAMFASRLDRIEMYGRHLWTLDASYCVPIDDLRDIIAETWDADKADNFEAAPYIVGDYWYTVDGFDVAEDANPRDIVNGAQAWDCWEFVQWFWERIAEPRGIVAVSTRDGAICYDETLIMAASEAA